MSALQKLGRFFTLIVRFVPAIVGTVLLVIVIAWMSGAFHEKVPPGESPDSRPLPAGTETDRVELFTTTEQVDAVGAVQPRVKTDVASRLLATINEIHVDPGDRVTEGQLLATLDDRETQAQLREVEAAATGIEANLAVRSREFTRYRQMFSERAVTKDSFDQVQGAYQVAQAQLERMNAQINRIKVILTYTQIRAQTSGIVVDRYLDPGDLAVPGKPLLTIHEPQDLELHASVREGLTGNIRVGMSMSVRIDAISRTMTGTVREIVPRTEATSRSVLVKVTLPPNQLDGLYIGMFGRLSIPIGNIDRVVVASDAIQRIGQLDIVDVVRDDGSLDRRFVCTGMHLEKDKIEVLSGLDIGETVARHPHHD